MQRQLTLIAAVVLVCLPALLAAAGRGRGGKSGNHEEGHHRNCGQWTDGQCVPSNSATCGEGQQTKTRTGDNCPVKEKSVKCHVPCPPGENTTPAVAAAAGAAPAGRGGHGRKGGRQRCDYIKGEWSACDSNNQRTRTLTLNTPAGEQPPAHCRVSKTIKKKCPNKNRANRGGRGEGRNARGN